MVSKHQLLWFWSGHSVHLCGHMLVNCNRFMLLKIDSVLLQVQFDLVTAAFTLSELPGVKDREEAVQTLWRKTNSYLVG